MFNEADTIKLRRFCQEICRNPRMMTEQPYKSDGKSIWCEDWELIEICKYLFHGKKLYQGDPPPNRLKNNPLWSKKDIMFEGDWLIDKHKTAQAIIDVLAKRRRNGS